MTSRRLAAVAAGAVVLALALVGCTKPGPGITVFSGTSSANREAACWSFDGSGIDAAACAKDVLDSAAAGAAIATIPVIPGTVVGISDGRCGRR